MYSARTDSDTPLVLGQGIPLRPSRTIRPADSVPSDAAPADLLGRAAPADMALSRAAPADLLGRAAPADMALSRAALAGTASRLLLLVPFIECAILGERRDRPGILSCSDLRTQRESGS